MPAKSRQSSGNPDLLETGRLKQGQPHDQSILHPIVEYRPMPDPAVTAASKSRPVWRVRFELASNPGVCFGLDLNGEVTLGRGEKGSDFVDLTPYGGLQHGVSRRHVMLRPTTGKLVAVDLNSTNGTQRNGHSIGVRTPCLLKDLDTLSLGGLSLMVRIIQRPHTQAAALREDADVAESLIEIADDITSHLDLDEILNQITETARALTSAGEVGVWLIDDQTGELCLEAQRGIDDDQLTRMRPAQTTDSLVAEVLKISRPIRASRAPEGRPIKVKTGHLVEALIYVPLSVAGVTFGVLMVAHRETGKEFSERDERLLAAIGHFAAIAVQNSRLYAIADKALQKQARELEALNELTRAVSSSLDLASVYQVLGEQISKRWTVDDVSLWLVDDHDGQISRYTPDGKAPQQSLKSVLSLVTQAIADGKPGHASRLATQHVVGTSDTLIATGAAVSVPLRIKEQVVGALVLYRSHGDKFTDEDIARLQSFANSGASAVQNARLFAQAERERAAIRAITRAFPHPLLLMDESGDVLISNDAAERLLGSHLSDVFETIETSLGHTSRAMIAGRTYLATSEYEPGLGTLALMQDISDYHRAEDALRQSEERYRTLIETSPDAITVTNLEGVVTVCSWQAARLHGLSGPEEAVGKNAFDFVAPEDRQRAAENMQKVLASGAIRNLEYTLLKKDGTRFPVEMNASLLLDAEKQPAGFIAVVRDITHIKQLEKTRADFVHALSHDLKGPLSSIRGWAELLQHVDPQDDSHSRYVSRIIASCDALFDMVGQLLDVTVPNHVPRLNLVPCQLDEIVSKVVAHLEGAARVKTIQLDYHVEGKPYTIKADSARLYRTVLNVLDNAIKYSPDKAKVTVSLNFNRDVTIAVRDTGPGIPQEDLDYVFDPYYRGRQAESGLAGIGLGLATAKVVVAAHGGAITVRNAPGGGAEFVISLPDKLRGDEDSAAAKGHK